MHKNIVDRMQKLWFFMKTKGMKFGQASSIAFFFLSEYSSVLYYIWKKSVVKISKELLLVMDSGNQPKLPM